ncbi:MAG: hypothetical protein N4A46_00090, partial [Schleiferiaceae bacterium]|nr:hypothetical protein [Schleiferiaceae bacterium]
MKKMILGVFCALFTFGLKAETEDSLSWPRDIISGKYTTTLYQPQYDSFESNILEGRMAFSIQENDDMPLFGALWFSSKIATDKEERMVYLESISITRMNFPEAEDEEKLEKLKDYLENEMESWDVEMSVDHFTAALSTLDLEHKTDANLNNAPPKIIYKTEAAILISIDGDPIWQKDESGNLEYIINTSFLI